MSTNGLSESPPSGIVLQKITGFDYAHFLYTEEGCGSAVLRALVAPFGALVQIACPTLAEAVMRDSSEKAMNYAGLFDLFTRLGIAGVALTSGANDPDLFFGLQAAYNFTAAVVNTLRP